MLLTRIKTKTQELLIIHNANLSIQRKEYFYLYFNRTALKRTVSSIREKMFVRANELAPEIMRFVNDYNVLLYEPDG
jgi:hypothetical protein